MPLMRSYTVDAFVDYFIANPDDTMTAIVEEDVVVKSGFTPSFDFGLDGKKWVLSGMNIMDRAKILLKSTDLSIEEIAAILGYSNSSNFYKAFKACFHMSPREYQKQFPASSSAPAP